MPKFLSEINQHGLSHPPVILIGCKCDSDNRQVSTQEAQDLAKKAKIPYFEVSKTKKSNIEFAFHTLAELIIYNKAIRIVCTVLSFLTFFKKINDPLETQTSPISVKRGLLSKYVPGTAKINRTTLEIILNKETIDIPISSVISVHKIKENNFILTTTKESYKMQINSDLHFDLLGGMFYHFWLKR